MYTIFLVAKHAIGSTLRDKSYWLVTLALPMLMVPIVIAGNVRNTEVVVEELAVSSPREQSSTTFQEMGGIANFGLVDQANLIQRFPPEIPQSLFTTFPDRSAAEAALARGAAEQVIYIPVDYLASGRITILARDFQIRMNGDEMGLAYNSPDHWRLQYLLDYNLVDDETLLAQYGDPLPVKQIATHPLGERKAETENPAMASMVATLMPYIFYGLLLTGGGYMLRAVVFEKQNRTAEVMLTTLPARNLLVGKMLAMLVMVLLQLGFFAALGIVGITWSASEFNLDTFVFPSGFWPWSVAFLSLGFLLYAAIMGAAGAMANTAREAGPVTWLLIVFLLPPMMFSDTLISQPNSPLTLFLSLFPLSSTSTMITRLAVGEVPLGLLAVSLAILAASTFLVISLAGRFFSAGKLLSSTPFNLRRFATAWRT